MPSPREVRRAAARLIRASRRLRRARALSAADYAYALDVVRRETVDRIAASTPIGTLTGAAEDSAAMAALADAFATVLDVAGADIVDLARVPGIDLSEARRLRAAARDTRDALASSAAPRFTPDAPTAAQTVLIRSIRRRVLVDRALGERRETVRTVAKEARRLLSAARNSGPVSRFVAGPRGAARGDAALARLTELIGPHIDDDLAGETLRRLRAARLVPVGADEVWKDFRDHPDEYYAVLEATSGGPRRAPRDYGPLPRAAVTGAIQTRLDLSLLRTPLEPAQRFAAQFAVHQGRIVLGDDATLDPTLEVLAVASHLAAVGQRHTLILAPPRRLAQWEEAVREHTSLTPVGVGANAGAPGLTEWRAVGGMAIGTDAVLGARGAFRAPTLSLLVVDEAHHVAGADAAAKRRVAAAADLADRVILVSDRATRSHPDIARILACIARPDLIPAFDDDSDTHASDARLGDVHLSRAERVVEGQRA